MRPFFPYAGSKWNLAPKYGAPAYSTVIEPFAGSAAYSVRHNTKRAILIDTSPEVIATWQYLINASAEDIQKLPIDFETLVGLDLPLGAKYLIGFWISKGTSVPQNKKSRWAIEYRDSTQAKVWNEAARNRIASQVESIKEWEAYNIDYQEIENIEVTWFIDPPYQTRGKAHYPRHYRMNYEACAEFCLSRKGQVIVCEGEGGDWLPFEHLYDARGTFGKHRSGVSREYAYLKGNT